MHQTGELADLPIVNREPPTRVFRFSNLEPTGRFGAGVAVWALFRESGPLRVFVEMNGYAGRRDGWGHERGLPRRSWK